MPSAGGQKPEEGAVAPPDEDAAAKAAAEAEAKRAAEDAEADKYFKDAPKLPPNASPKSSDAFRSVKVQAARDLADRDKQIEDLKKQLGEATERGKNPITPEIESELKELREWRAKLDVEADPKFKEFDKQVEAGREFVYDQLRKLPGINDALIEQIKAYGGPDKTNLSKVWEAVKDPVTQRIVESAIADIEKAKYQKAAASKSTQANIQQYITDRSKAWETAATQHNTATKTALNEITSGLDWFKPKVDDPKADDKGKAEIKAHNDFLVEVNKQLEQALADDSPQMRAIMLVGMTNLFRYQKILPVLQQRAESAEKALAEANAKLEKSNRPA